jgi:ribonuclease-3
MTDDATPEVGPTSEQLSVLESELGYRFKNRNLLQTALTHRSHSHEYGIGPAGSYERFEFLGDALLGLFVADWLFRKDTVAGEGDLSRRRQTVVRTSSLAAIARRIGLGDAIRLGRGEELTGGRRKTSLLADVFEAVLGAVYLDGGIRPARAFVHRHLGEALIKTGEQGRRTDDYKTRLQEAVQAKLQRTPSYRIVSTTGPAHALDFEVEVLVEDRVLGRGRGSNRKRAEQDAARQAIEDLDSSDSSK